ncbi:DNA ligase 1-like [Silene latifolia]|uniref:DNA ligase 1-like n=1 Tax=Silene latifolia TaxID=37657 RepID=UPI003D780D11
MKNAFDVLRKAAARTSANKPKRSRNGKEECVSKKKSSTLLSKTTTQDYIDVNVDLLKTKISNLKKDPISFNPDSVTCCFSRAEDGQLMPLPFVFVCFALELMSDEPKRSIITYIACNMLRIAMSSSQQEEDLVAILGLLSYKIAPMTDGGSDQLGIGEHNIAKAIAETYGSTTDLVKSRLKDKGDLGLVAQTARSTQSKLFNFKPKPLSVSEVYHSFQKIAQISGNDSKGKKISILRKLLSASRECEPKYLIRLLFPKIGLRIGGAEATLLDALGRAAVFLEKDNPPSLEEGAAIVKQAFAVLPDYDKIVHALFSIGVRKLQKSYGPSVGTAMAPMLCKAIGSVHDAIKKFGNCPYICEYKYDGERAQIHFMEDGRVEIFSRNLECSTRKYPDVVDTVKRLKMSSVTSFIMDCEIVAFDRSSKKLVTFQKLMTRPRKDVDIDDIKINVCIFAFDLLYLNSQSLIQEQLGVRRKHLLESFDEDAGYLQFATALSSQDPKLLQNFLEESASASCEGLIFKPLGMNSKYEPGKRNWLKLKKDFIESMWDSLDLVPIGAFYGCGKRTGVYGTFLLACYVPDTEEFQTICNAGTGLSDQLLDDCHERFAPKVITNPKSNYIYNADIQPDVWFEPTEVWEVKAGGLTISSVYSAAIGLVDSDKGLSLRNPAVLRVRVDKVPEMATTADQVAEMYSQQWRICPNSERDDGEEVN